MNKKAFVKGQKEVSDGSLPGTERRVRSFVGSGIFDLQKETWSSTTPEDQRWGHYSPSPPSSSDLFHFHHLFITDKWICPILYLSKVCLYLFPSGLPLLFLIVCLSNCSLYCELLYESHSPSLSLDVLDQSNLCWLPLMYTRDIIVSYWVVPGKGCFPTTSCLACRYSFIALCYIKVKKNSLAKYLRFLSACLSILSNSPNFSPRESKVFP